MYPTLVAFVDGAECARLEPPAKLDQRAWLLAVAAVQMNVADGVVRPVLRVHVTGADEPHLVPLAKRAQVDIALTQRGIEAPPPAPELTTPGLAGAAARMTIAVNGIPGRHAALQPDLLGANPPPRAFGHVYSRWLRDGGHESGYDLTDFQSIPSGVKYERIQSDSAQPPLVVSYVISVR